MKIRVLFMNKFFLFITFFSLNLFAQEADIVPALKQIESGNTAAAEKMLANLKDKTPDDPSVVFLDAVLTTNGKDAADKYQIVFDIYPRSRYADATLFRVFSYYFSIGLYKKADEYLTKLKSAYPQSPYIRAADRSIPDEDQPELTVSQPESAPTEKAYSYTIQAGAFLNSENANKLRDNFIKDGYTSEVIDKEVGGTVLSVVTLGKFISENAAAPTLTYLETKYNLKGRVVSINK